ncbi:hypothetical protein HJFPF1_08020 [Paramyrothecium foliicola]|nr:hypothetical protein HJFPF1_08020 [Paramyrothecium foliicola]
MVGSITCYRYLAVSSSAASLIRGRHNMTQIPAEAVEQLQRELEVHRKRALHLEQMLQGTLKPATPSSYQYHNTALSQTRYGLQEIKAAALARSHSNMGFIPNMSSPVTAFRRHGRALSQQNPTSQSMSRSISNRSEVGMPFRQNGPIAPLASASPTSSHFFSGHPELMNQRLPSVEEDSALRGIGVDPSLYIATTLDNDGHAQSYLATTGTNLYPHDHYTRQISTCPSLVSGYSINEGPVPLTRQNSSFGSPAGLNMTRIASCQSRVSDEVPNQDAMYQQPGSSYEVGKSSVSEQALLGLGANLPETVPSKFSSSPSDGNLLLSSPLSVSMDRSESNTSISSIKSTASHVEQRAKEARFRVLQNSKAAIAPKPSQGRGNIASDGSGTSLQQSTKSEMKLSSKLTYQRPKHPKVFCTQCSDHPEGFRGDHELRRHINAKHEGVVKKFVCRDPSTVGIATNVAVRYPLSKCKACVSGKQYGAYYNAAAHLRRTHFKPKASRGKNKGANDEKRGGKGGGNWPCMSDLKAWFEEVHVAANQATVGTDEEDEDMANIGLDLATDGFPVIEGDLASYNMIDHGTISLDGVVNPTIDLSVSSSMPMAPISSASVPFGFPTFSEEPHLNAITGEYAYSEHGAPTYGSTISSNTITPSTFQDVSHMGVHDGGWNLE